MKPYLLPYAKILTQACDRLFVEPVRLTEKLLTESARTMHMLSTRPEAFGELRPREFADNHQEALSNLLTAAKAFVSAHRKHQEPPQQQQLPL